MILNLYWRVTSNNYSRRTHIISWLRKLRRKVIANWRLEVKETAIFWKLSFLHKFFFFFLSLFHLLIKFTVTKTNFCGSRLKTLQEKWTFTTALQSLNMFWSQRKSQAWIWLAYFLFVTQLWSVSFRYSSYMLPEVLTLKRVDEWIHARVCNR